MSTRPHFVASKIDSAQQALAELKRRYGDHPLDGADVLVALGGDGFMLQALHRFARTGLPTYGMKLGTVGFLMNLYRPEALSERLAAAVRYELEPLEMTAITEGGQVVSTAAINEVSLLRQTKQAAKLKLEINGVTRLPELVCDGAMVATPVGSTAYNYSAYGPILPLGARALALTPISPFRPRRWRGALLPHDATVRFEVLDHYKRPVSATADSQEVRDVVEVTIRQHPTQRFAVLFDPEHNLEERMLMEQFAP